MLHLIIPVQLMNDINQARPSCWTCPHTFEYLKMFAMVQSVFLPFSWWLQLINIESWLVHDRLCRAKQMRSWALLWLKRGWHLAWIIQVECLARPHLRFGFKNPHTMDSLNIMFTYHQDMVCGWDKWKYWASRISHVTKMTPNNSAGLFVFQRDGNAQGASHPVS